MNVGKHTWMVALCSLAVVTGASAQGAKGMGHEGHAGHKHGAALEGLKAAGKEVRGAAKRADEAGKANADEARQAGKAKADEAREHIKAKMQAMHEAKHGADKALGHDKDHARGEAKGHEGHEGHEGHDAHGEHAKGAGAHDGHDHAERRKHARGREWARWKGRIKGRAHFDRNITQEFRKHALRKARLDRVAKLAVAADDKKSSERVEKLYALEDARHQRRMDALLTKLEPAMDGTDKAAGTQNDQDDQDGPGDEQGVGEDEEDEQAEKGSAP